MSNSNYDKANALRIEAGSCFFIFWKKHDHSESLPAHYVEYLLLIPLIMLIHLTRRTPKASTGNRIKKTSKTSGVVVYNFDGLYEIAKTPGEGDKHTLYFKGLHGDLFSQMTGNDAQLITSNSPFFLCSNISISCKDYYSNTIKFYLSNYAIKMYSIISKVEYDIAVWMLVVLSLYGFYFVYKKKEIGLTSEGIESKWFAKRTLSVTPLLTVAILFTFTNCGIFGGGKKKGDAPWLLLASGVNSNTPSVDDTSNGSSSGASGGGSGGSALVPVVGMYFLHPDHLGSITMITDGRGNMIAGGNNGGKSHISYKPYGEIHRTDSSGPDITRFKYTGQEEDKESGLMYYKARYYDPMVGRFLQADNEYNPDDTQGMNHYMYVNGSPMNFRDDTGNSCIGNYMSLVVGSIGSAFLLWRDSRWLSWIFCWSCGICRCSWFQLDRRGI